MMKKRENFFKCIENGDIENVNDIIIYLEMDPLKKILLMIIFLILIILDL